MNQYIGFYIDSSEYMLPILKVREIITMPSITSLPQLPEYVRGVTNLRGSVIPIVNLKKLLVAANDSNSGKTVIVLSTGKIVFGIIVDGISGVINIDESEIQLPESFFNTNIDKIEGVANIDDKLIVLLNTKRLLPLEDTTLFEEEIVNVKESDDGNNVEIIKEVDTIGGKVTVKELHNAKEFFSDKIHESDPRQKIFDIMLQIIDALASHDYPTVEEVSKELVKETNSDLFNAVGKITRKLHDSLEEFKSSVDNGLLKLTKDKFPNAVDKLEFVISKTEEAANKTMTIAERFFEESDDFSRHIEKIKGYDEEVDYLRTFKESLDTDLTEIITAQQFQDITGQTIRKVITLVHNVEVELVRLISNFGMPLASDSPFEVKTDTKGDEETGNDISNVSEKVSQSDVEALLSEFGF